VFLITDSAHIILFSRFAMTVYERLIQKSHNENVEVIDFTFKNRVCKKLRLIIIRKLIIILTKTPSVRNYG
jgi:hypothetical protein